MRILVDPVETGAVVLSLPQDVQSHAYDFPAEFFAERDWVIRRPAPDPAEVDAVAALLAAAEKPLIIAGGGVVYSDATAELERLAGAVGIPVAGDLRRQGRGPAAAPGGSSAASAWRAPRPPTPWPARPTWSSPSGPG